MTAERSCLDLLDRQIDKAIHAALKARGERAEFRSLLPKARLTKEACGSHIGAGITIGNGSKRHPTPAAMEVIREYANSATMTRDEAAAKAMISTETVKKYARLIREGKA